MSDNPEQAVERYFAYLADPDSLVDANEVARLQAEIADTSNLMERAKLLTQLERVESADDSAVIEGFVRNARSWAAANDVSASALQGVGVPADVLVAAGMLGSKRRGRKPGVKGTRGRGVSSTSIREHIAARTDEFTLQTVMAEAGGSLMTVRKVVDAMLEDGEVRRLGPAADWSGPGRAPNLYSVK